MSSGGVVTLPLGAIELMAQPPAKGSGGHGESALPRAAHSHTGDVAGSSGHAVAASDDGSVDAVLGVYAQMICNERDFCSSARRSGSGRPAKWLLLPSRSASVLETSSNLLTTLQKRRNTPAWILLVYADFQAMRHDCERDTI